MPIASSVMRSFMLSLNYARHRSSVTRPPGRNAIRECISCPAFHPRHGPNPSVLTGSCVTCARWTQSDLRNLRAFHIYTGSSTVGTAPRTLYRETLRALKTSGSRYGATLTPLARTIAVITNVRNWETQGTASIWITDSRFHNANRRQHYCRYRGRQLTKKAPTGNSFY